MNSDTEQPESALKVGDWVGREGDPDPRQIVKIERLPSKSKSNNSMTTYYTLDDGSTEPSNDVYWVPIDIKPNRDNACRDFKGSENGLRIYAGSLIQNQVVFKQC